jgi:hypothetical protein
MPKKNPQRALMRVMRVVLDDRFHETDQLEPSDPAGKCGSSSWLHMIRTLETLD